MIDDNQRYAASLELVVFMNRFTELLETQLGSIRGVIETAVQTVMLGISQLSEETAAKAVEANRILDETYMNPDAKTTDLVNKIQDSADAVFEMARKGQFDQVGTKAAAGNLNQHDMSEQKMRRVGGLFSKHMEAVGMMDDALSQILVEMMGALSTDDLIRQKLEHILQMVHALQVGLSYIMIDFKKKFTSKDVEALIADLLFYSYSIYTAEVEKEVFRKHFETPQKVDFSIFRS